MGRKACRNRMVRKIVRRGDACMTLTALAGRHRYIKEKIRSFERIFGYLSVFSRKIIPSFSDFLKLDQGALLEILTNNEGVWSNLKILGRELPQR